MNKPRLPDAVKFSTLKSLPSKEFSEKDKQNCGPLLCNFTNKFLYFTIVTSTMKRGKFKDIHSNSLYRIHFGKT